MRNPLENEEVAFRFVLGTIAYLTPIVLASWIATWLGVVVFVVMTAVAVAVLRGDAKPLPAAPSAGRASVEDTWRVLVIANETLGADRLQEVIARLVDGVAEDVLIVCPVLAAPVPTGRRDEDSARATAELRLRSALDTLRAAGVNVRGQIDDGDPLVALENALRGFAADEIVISTHGEDDSRWLEQRLVDAAGSRFGGPVTHVIADASPLT